MKYAVLLLALMFAGCGGGLSTEEEPYMGREIDEDDMGEEPYMGREIDEDDMGYETFTIVGETMQVAKEDFPDMMTWDEAYSACEGLGNGWRLPTDGQLKAIYEQLHKQGKGNFILEQFADQFVQPLNRGLQHWLVSHPRHRRRLQVPCACCSGFTLTIQLFNHLPLFGRGFRRVYRYLVGVLVGFAVIRYGKL